MKQMAKQPQTKGGTASSATRKKLAPRKSLAVMDFPKPLQARAPGKPSAPARRPEEQASVTPQTKVIEEQRPVEEKKGRSGTAAMPFPWLTLFLEGSEQFANSLQPGKYFPWLSQVLEGHEQATSAAPGAGDEQTEYLEGPPTVDRMIHAATSQFTLGISPAAMSVAFADWATHLAWAPGKQEMLLRKAMRKTARFNTYAMRCAADPDTPGCIEPLAQDKRFRAPAWQQWPYNLIYQSFLLTQQWWHNATTGVRGVNPHHENVVNFVTRQMLDVVAPSNFMATNPELLEITAKQGGENLIRGAVNFIEDWERAVAGRPPVGAESLEVGRDLAVTPGKVIYRNRLMELIQYEPSTDDVYAEPILIVPAWIMKYYILDLSPANSLVRYLVEQGHTVFIISWRNPGVEDRDVSMEDYRRLGVNRALNVVRSVVPDRKINAVGYCLGGTLLTIEAAALARDGEEWLNTITLLAAQTDFREAGELALFVDYSELTFLEDVMWDQGYLDTKQMAGAFQMLRSNDLVWSRILHSYLIGRREKMSDLMVWNADATRMPYKMHSQYLRSLFLNNDLVEGRYEVDGLPIALSDIRAPMFVVGTETDHVAPWRSVYKIHLPSDTDVAFVLTSGGHNAGIVSEPGHPRRHYRISHRRHDERYIDPTTWLEETQKHDGSWWPAWGEWLVAHASDRVLPPPMGAPEKGHEPITNAPGTYVMQR
jgi:polyhydroxyalkanoate synthase